MKLLCDMTIKISKRSNLWNLIILDVVMYQSFDISICLTTRWSFIARISWKMKITSFSGSIRNQSQSLHPHLNEFKKNQWLIYKYFGSTLPHVTVWPAINKWASFMERKRLHIKLKKKLWKMSILSPIYLHRQKWYI